ncbi:protein-S-isoprenylcysteine O-methyltransferase [Mesorhizobium koreense]|uniref:protein-S-isoprenylcysteine O-methyltransferase n=1 Tax=Mesorhizobium koreense TaxID=3074855 RepID=UPI00287B60C1|nr:protein-S-isoprenylcysteine O-methyltransferase [Mesorhizobium sp. WR6]
MSLVVAGKALWAVLVVTWYVLRVPFARRSKRTRISRNAKGMAERLRLAISTIGLGIVPFIYVATGWPRFASYRLEPIPFLLGVLAAVGAVVLFRLTHKALGRMWSVSLQLREGHRLVTSGVYRTLRHPMYSAFWLMALAQALLLPNWVAGPAGLVGFGLLFASRIGPEERMMEEAFGDEYRAYRDRSWRIIPYIY